MLSEFSIMFFLQRYGVINGVCSNGMRIFYNYELRAKYLLGWFTENTEETVEFHRERDF